MDIRLVSVSNRPELPHTSAAYCDNSRTPTKG